MAMQSLDPVALTQDLIRRPSVTPADAGAMDTLQRTLDRLGFECRRMKFGQIENLYARRGTASPNLCFAGHTDVFRRATAPPGAMTPSVPMSLTGYCMAAGP